MQFSFSKYYLFFALPVVIACIFWIQLTSKSDMQSREKVAVGTIVSLKTEAHWYGDTTYLTLDNGTQIALSGTFNPWRTGQEVTQPKPTNDGKIDTADIYWCVGNTCLTQK